MAVENKAKFKVKRENWLEDHPKFKGIQSYGYYNENPAMARAAMTVYLDLCEVKHWFDVSIRPCESLRLVYITGKRTKKSAVSIVVPVTIDTCFTMEEIKDIIEDLNTCEEEGREVSLETECAPRSVTMAFCESDSTVVYYDFFRGLIPPDPPTEEDEEKVSRPKRRRTKLKNTN